MGRSKLSKALFVGALALSASSAVPARPIAFASEARDHVTFGNAIIDTTGNSVSFGLSSTSTVDDGRKVVGEIPHPTSPFGGTPAAVNSGSVFGWDLDSKTELNHGANGHELVGTIDAMKFHGKHEHDVSPVSAIPEPATYTLLVAGLAGMAIITRRRRRGSR
jgi:hypothetical protein